MVDFSCADFSLPVSMSMIAAKAISLLKFSFFLHFYTQQKYDVTTNILSFQDSLLTAAGQNYSRHCRPRPTMSADINDSQHCPPTSSAVNVGRQCWLVVCCGLDHVFKVTPLFDAKYVTNGYRYGHSYYRRRIGNRTQAFEWHQFQWPWVTFKPDFKVTVLFNVK